MRMCVMQNKWQISFEVVHILLEFVFFISLPLPHPSSFQILYVPIPPIPTHYHVGFIRRSFAPSQFVFLLRCRFTVLSLSSPFGLHHHLRFVFRILGAVCALEGRFVRAKLEEFTRATRTHVVASFAEFSDAATPDILYFSSKTHLKVSAFCVRTN